VARGQKSALFIKELRGVDSCYEYIRIENRWKNSHQKAASSYKKNSEVWISILRSLEE
jgi:hypothetical protein